MGNKHSGSSVGSRRSSNSLGSGSIKQTEADSHGNAGVVESEIHTRSGHNAEQSADSHRQERINQQAPTAKDQSRTQKPVQVLKRAKSALPASSQIFKESPPVPRSKSVPVLGYRRADINLADEVLEEASRLQETLKEEFTVQNDQLALSDIAIDTFKKKCESFVFGAQKLSGVPGQERAKSGVIPPHIAVSCIKGLKGVSDSSPNQDNWSYCKFGQYEFFCVQDGHGPQGHLVSFRGIQTLPHFITSSSKFPRNIPDAISEGYIRCHEDLVRHSVEHDYDIQVSGCACVLVIRKDRTLWVSHAGDSRVVIGSVSSDLVEAETADHKPTDPTERSRLETNGSEIQTFSFDGNVKISRVFVRGADFPGLCMSRSLGDQCVKDHGVIPTPEVFTFDVTPKKTFIVLASDGVWEFVPSKLVCSSLSKKLPGEGKDKCVARIVTEAKKRWKSHEVSYCDDITAMLVLL
jgi:serine/threonine protein phosphatase PrpC